VPIDEKRETGSVSQRRHVQSACTADIAVIGSSCSLWADSSSSSPLTPRVPSSSKGFGRRFALPKDPRPPRHESPRKSPPAPLHLDAPAEHLEDGQGSRQRPAPSSAGPSMGRGSLGSAKRRPKPLELDGTRGVFEVFCRGVEVQRSRRRFPRRLMPRRTNRMLEVW
jgi:hypothetical protein